MQGSTPNCKREHRIDIDYDDVDLEVSGGRKNYYGCVIGYRLEPG
jgi:hypothetical protein